MQTSKATTYTHSKKMICTTLCILVLHSLLFYICFVVPGPVKALSYCVLSNTSVRIMWNSPNEPNGIITGYDVVYGVYEEDTSIKVDVERELTLTINNLSELSDRN